ncbi:hypothetical protein MUP00_11655, partial [Candidatus Bathyarchaeota archaeon]|nr:hypothetical protein [Candidatus Bathyarchaeota archaeon]
MKATDWPRFVSRCPMCHGALGSRINSDIVAVLACQQCGAQFKFSAVGRGYLYMTSMGSDPDRLVLTDEEEAYNDPRLWQQIDEKSPRQVVRARDVSSDGTAPRDNYQVPFGREREEILGQVGARRTLCEHLGEIGVKATLLDFDDPQAFMKPLDSACDREPSFPYVLGCVRIEGRNLDMIVVQPRPHYRAEGEESNYTQIVRAYSYYYITRVDTDGLAAVRFVSDWRDRCCLRRFLSVRTLVLPSIGAAIGRVKH